MKDCHLFVRHISRVRCVRDESMSVQCFHGDCNHIGTDVVCSLVNGQRFFFLSCVSDKPVKACQKPAILIYSSRLWTAADQFDLSNVTKTKG